MNAIDSSKIDEDDTDHASLIRNFPRDAQS